MTEKEYNPKTDPEVIEFKKVIRAVLMTALIMILISTIWTIFASFGYGNLKTSAVNDVEYIFENDILYSNNSVDYVSQFNMRNRTMLTGNYNATYSFEDDIIGNNPIDWIIVESGGNVNVVDEKEGHIDVVEIEDINSNNCQMYQSVGTSVFFGVIEWWWLTNDSFQINDFGTYGGATSSNLFLIQISNNEFKYFDSGWQSLGHSATNNTWYHIRATFECSVGNYGSLDQYDYNLEINGIPYGDFDFISNQLYLEYVKFESETVDLDYSIYIDAIGYSWDYNITYDFNQDIVGQEPVGWISDNGIDCSTLIKDELDDEINVLELFDNNLTEIADIYAPIKQTANQEIEFDIAKSEIINKRGFIFLRENISVKIYLNFYANDFYTHVVAIKENFLTANTFFKIKIVLDDTANTFDCYIDGVLEGNDLAYFTASTISVDNIQLTTETTLADYSFYIDNILVSSDLDYNYFIGDNLINTVENTSIIEVDKTEFTFEALNDFNDVGEDNPSGWVDIEDGGDNVNIALDSGDVNDRVLEFDGDGDTIETIGSTKDFNIVDGMLDISWSLYVEQRNTSEGSFNVSIYSKDLTLQVAIGMRYYNPVTGSELTYYNGSQYIVLINYSVSQIGDDDKLEFYLIIEDGDNLCSLVYYENDILTGSWNFSKINTAKDGLGKIDFIQTTPSNEPSYAYIIYLDWIGIYADSISINDDYGYSTVKMYVNGWIYDYWNLFYITADAYMEVGVCSAADTDPYDPEQNSEVIKTLYQYNNTEVFENLADNPYVIPWGADTIFYPVLLFFIKGGEFEINSIRIEGVRLVDDSHGNSYILEYNSGSVDLDESYFYVSESDNRLRFTMTTDDSNLEFIEASFVVQYQNTFNYSMLWGGLKTYTNMEAEFRIEYTDTTYFPYLLTTNSVYKNNIIAQGMIINGFSLIITDNDNDAMGIITGYIESIILIFTPYAAFDIIISDYLGILTPILLIVVITITIWQSTKKVVKFMLIVPSMLFMSFSVFLMDMIPLWLFFVIIAAGVVFVYTKWEDMFSIFTGFASMITGFLTYAGIVDFWVFYLSFFIMVGYVIFGIRKNVVG